MKTGFENLDLQLVSRINRAFTPSTPINTLSLFAGRQEQCYRLLNACFQRGQHAVLYGERGVGKTSLARIIVEAMERAGVTVPKCGTVNCDQTDSFSTIWHKAFREVEVVYPKCAIGFGPTDQFETTTLDDCLPETITPEDVRQAISTLKTDSVFVIDELDRLTDPDARMALADTIKTLSDHLSKATIVLIGVASSVGELVSQHKSIDRALVQIHMPRMSSPEISEIIHKGESIANVEFTDQARGMIMAISKGLPHYTHLLCLNSALNAVPSTTIAQDDVRVALETIVNNKTTITSAYELATMSNHRDSLYERVLISCAMCEADQDGYFGSSDVADQLTRINGRQMPVSSFSRHLNDFCDQKRGQVLSRLGTERRYRYRFNDPLLQPFTMIKGMLKGIIVGSFIEKMVQLELELNVR